MKAFILQNEMPQNMHNTNKYEQLIILKSTSFSTKTKKAVTLTSEHSELLPIIL